jgi:peptidyl-tRNA hydrolase, PTH1 family
MASEDIKLIVGLGNPGEKYRNTKHNAGFIFVDHLAEQLGVTFSYEKKFDSELARSNNTILVKPQTFMNTSGPAVARLVDYYNIKDLGNLTVVNDDVDLPPLAHKCKKASGPAGHHGVEDIIEKLGSKDFWRLRVGVGRPENKKYDVRDFVLSRFSDQEIDYIKNLTKVISV